MPEKHDGENKRQEYSGCDCETCQTTKPIINDIIDMLQPINMECRTIILGYLHGSVLASLTPSQRIWFEMRFTEVAMDATRKCEQDIARKN